MPLTRTECRHMRKDLDRFGIYRTDEGYIIKRDFLAIGMRYLITTPSGNQIMLYGRLKHVIDMIGRDPNQKRSEAPEPKYHIPVPPPKKEVRVLENGIKISVDTTEVDQAIEKANRLVGLLREAADIISSLSGGLKSES